MIISRVRVCESACRFQSAAVPTRLSCHVSQLTTSRIAWQHTKMPAATSHTDIILPMRDPYMEQIVDGTKNHEFRKYRLKSGIRRVWFYRTAPHSRITHICEILPARTRNPGDPPLEENGLGNAEYNARHPDWDGYDFAYKILSVWELVQPISLATMRNTYGFRSATRGLVYLPKEIGKRVTWNRRKKILDNHNMEAESRPPPIHLAAADNSSQVVVTDTINPDR